MFIRFSVLYYKRDSDDNKKKNTKDNGCTVDLLTKHSNIIKFRTGVKNKDGTDKCLVECSNKFLTFDGASANM